MIENQIYKVRKINPNSWSGIRLYPFSNEGIGCGLDDLTGLPITGLTENTYKVDDQKRKVEVKGTREKMEKLLGLDKDTLRVGSTLKPSEFWINFAIQVGEADLILNTSIPDHQLKVLFLEAQPQIANGISNRKAKSEYLLYTPEEEAKSSNSKKKVKRVAYSLFEKLTQEDKTQILEMAGTPTKSLTADVIDDKLSDYMEEYPSKFTAMVEDPARKNKAFVRHALERGVVTMEDGAFMYGETVLGFDIDSTTAKLFSVENAKTREAIKLQLGTKK